MTVSITFESGLSKEDISKLMDAEVEVFSKYMETIADLKAAGALHPIEKMLLKTYLIYKYKK